MKQCNTCGISKELSEFSKRSDRSSGYKSNCILCERNRNKEYYKNNIEKEKLRKKEYSVVRYALNPAKVKLETRKWTKTNRIKNPSSRMIESVRTRVYEFLKRNNITKRNKTFEIVGCTPEFLKEYLANLFIEDMSWENYGRNGWSIDHIIPLSSVSTKEEIYKLCYYTNLQPLWERDNIIKGNKIFQIR
jgi:hypothetical protein